MARWILITVAVIVTSTLIGKVMRSAFDLSGSRLLKGTPIEKLVSKTFFHTSEMKNPLEQHQEAPKKQKMLTSPVSSYVYKPIQQKQLLDAVKQKNEKLDKERQKKLKEEQARRKKRKKKLEALAKKDDQKPKLDVTILTDTKRTRVQEGEDRSEISYGGYVIPTEPEKTQPQNTVKKFDFAGFLKSLLANPTPRNMSTLVSLYKSGQISPQEFYHTLNVLQKSEKPQTRFLAVQAAKLQLRPEAFEILAQRSFDSDPSVQDLAVKSLEAYNSLNTLDVLSKELRRGSIFGKIKASEILNTVALSYQSMPNRDPSKLPIFSSFIDILKPMTEDTSQPQLQNVAQTTLITLESLFTSSSSTTTASLE